MLILSLIGPIRYDGTINMSYISEKFSREMKLLVSIYKIPSNKILVFGSSRTDVGYANIENVINLGLPGGSINEALALISFIKTKNQKILLLEKERLSNDYQEPKGLGKRYVCALSNQYCRNKFYLYYFNIPLSFDLIKNFILYKLKLKNLIYTKNGSKTDEFMKHWQSFQKIEKLYSVSQIKWYCL